MDVRRLPDGSPVVLEVNARFGALSPSVGTTSPYPTVVTVCSAHHRPVPRSKKSSGSRTQMSTPPRTTLTAVAVTMTDMALRTDSGVRRKVANRRSTRCIRCMSALFAARCTRNA